MKTKYLLCLISIMFMLTGCSFVFSPLGEEADNTWEEEGYIEIGSRLTVTDNGGGFVLLNNKDVLSSDGLYYASWVIGEAKPFEKSDGATLDVYDAQLYLLLGEFSSSEKAADNMETWLDAGKSNYEILSEKKIVCNEQEYTLIIYNCTNEDNPYDRGASAFGIYGETAVCVELTCIEGFEEESEVMLTSFLNGCTYGAD